MKRESVELYRALGYKGELPDSKAQAARKAPAGPKGKRTIRKSTPKATSARRAEARGQPPQTELPLMTLEHLATLEQQLENAPNETLARAQEAFDRPISLAELHQMIDEARGALATPKRYLSARKARLQHAEAMTRLPPDFTFPGMNLKEIDIDPWDMQFEDADALGWILFSGLGWIKDKVGAELGTADFRWHDRADSGFVYPLHHPYAEDKTSIALLSDFGTGTYAPRYIAKQLREAKLPYVIHLGDVYYAGRTSEFEHHVASLFEPLIEGGTRVFLMNANHEMYSGGEPYFDYLKQVHSTHPGHEQEGSYFCLRASGFQVVGIDTAYHKIGRHREPKLNGWLMNVLKEGQETGSINILLSQNAPYRYGSRNHERLLDEDLREIVDAGLVDLWFWGDTHYCALFNRSEATPFIGSCIGHGGKPYPRQRVGEVTPAPLKFLETAARFPRKTKLRKDRGNNGYCVMTLIGSDTIELTYIDWMSNVRCEARLHRTTGTARLKLGHGLMEHPIP